MTARPPRGDLVNLAPGMYFLWHIYSIMKLNYIIPLPSGLDVNEARSREERLMLADANKLLNLKNISERTDLYCHPKSGATPLHVAAAKGYSEVLR